MDAQTTVTVRCAACGTLSEVRPSCGCGANFEYVSPGELAAKAVKDNPEKSNRAIADDLGVGSNTVRRARQATAPNGAVDGKRTGRDGKARKMPRRKSKPPGVKQAQRSIDLDADTWEQIKARAAAAEIPAAQFIGTLLTATINPEIDIKTLSKTAQDKLGAAIRQHMKKLNSEFELRVQAATKERTDKVFPRLQKIEDEARDTKRNYEQLTRMVKKVGTGGDWNNLVVCLHPDTRRTASDEKFDAALAWVLSKKLAFTGEK